MQHPYVGFFPALPLRKQIELGEWIVGRPPTTVPWHSPRFKELLGKLLSSFETDKDERFQGGALLWRKTSGFDGNRPSDAEFVAIQAAVRFAALDTNDRVQRDDPYGGHRLVTSENAALHLQPIDLETGYITHVRDGALKRVLTGGWKIGDRPPPLADATLPITLGDVPASSKLANAVLHAHLAQDTDDLRRLQIAIEWHAVALSNPVAVTMQQRFIALKTGFEALLDSSKSREAAHRLRALFEGVAKPHHDLFPCAEVLWSSTERTDLRRTWNKKVELWSELEDWFMTLAEARNKIIHEGRVSVTQYKAPPERPLSRYAGHLFWIGERVLREAIKARLGPEILLCGPLKRLETFRPLLDALKAQAAARTNTEDGASEEAKDDQPPPRTLDALLTEVGGAAANQVLIGWAPGGSSASLEAAKEMAKAASWVAKAGGKEVWISEEEKTLLEQAGAEMELPDHIDLCD
jgi:hypothetical protein